MVCPDSNTFNSLVAGKLAPERRAELADHAASCDACRELLGALLGVTAASLPAAAAAAAGGPDRVGRYVIERRIGAGAMGVVFAAWDPELERPVAIKVLRSGASADRLKREAQMLARLHHPNVVTVFDVGEHEGQNFVAMALVDGENLRTWLTKAHTPDEVLRVVRDAARGLAAAHAAGVIHRDLKPDNVFIARDGAVQVGDFGLARSSGDADVASDASGSLELTQTGMVLGTPAYMAPEHAEGEPTPASDQFSLCVTAWEAFYGMRPFAAKTFGELRDAIVAGRIVEPPEETRVPARVRAALERGLSADPEARFPSIVAFEAALASPRRRWPWLAAGAAVVAIVFASVAITKRAAAPRCEQTAHELDDTWGQVQRSQFPAPARELVDGYASDWLALRHETCVAPRDGDDARVRCLDRARDVLRDLISKVDANTDLDRLHVAVQRLPGLGDCRSALEGTASLAQRTAGEALMARIDKASTQLWLLGPAGLAGLHALQIEAERLGYEPAIVNAACVEAETLARTAQPEAAEAILRRSMSHAEASHDDRSVAMVAARLAPIAIGLGKLDEARAMIELGAAAIARSGGDPGADVELTDARARLASMSGDHAQAIALIKQTIEPVRARTGSNSAEVVELYMMLAREYGWTGQFAEAREASEHVQFAEVAAFNEQGQGDLMVLAQKINSAYIATDVPRIIELGQRLGALGRETKQPAIEQMAAMDIARAYELAGDDRMMIESYGHVLELLDKEPGGGDLDPRAGAYEGIGRAYLGLGDAARAIEPLRKAVDANLKIGKFEPREADQREAATIALGEALVDTGKAHEARALLEPILREITDDPNAFVHRRGGAEFQLARALWDDGNAHDRDRAHTLADAALHDFQAAVDKAKAPAGLALAAPRFQKRVDEVTAWLARRK